MEFVTAGCCTNKWLRFDYEMSEGMHSRNLILGLECFFALYTQWKSSPYSFCAGVNQEN